jgi:DNA replication protein DnaC
MTQEEQQLSERIQELQNRERKKKLGEMDISRILQTHARIIRDISEYDLSDYCEFDHHCALIEKLGDNYMGREFREFCVDNYNRDVLRFLVYYFNDCRLAEGIFPDRGYKIHKNLLIIGDPGTGKTLIMQIFSDYLKLTHNPNMFCNLSVTEMMNYYKIHGHIDRFTYNETAEKGPMGGNPFNVCINDIGLETENQKSYGTSLDSVIDEFLYARYEIYQSHFKKYHITSNLTVKEFKARFGERLVDRFKSFNVIPLLGDSRRK